MSATETTPGDRRSAADIAGHALTETGAALLSRDFDRFAAHFSMPQPLFTPHGARQMETREDLLSAFDGVCTFFAEHGVTGLDRRVEKAFFEGPDLLHYTHVSQMLKGTQPLREPYSCQSVMRRQGDRWRVTESHYALGPDEDHAAALLSGRPEPQAASNAEAWGILHRVLRDVTRAYLTADFDLLRRRVQLPLFLQGNAGTQVFTDEAGLRRDLMFYKTEFEVHGVTDIFRTVKSAQIVGDRRIQGIYRTHVLRGSTLLLPAYVSSMSLERGEDRRWRMTAVLHPMGHLSPVFRQQQQAFGDRHEQ